MENITYNMIEKKLQQIIDWKSIALPSLLYNTNISNLTDDHIRDLQKIETNVYRCIIGAAHYSPNVTLREVN